MAESEETEDILYTSLNTLYAYTPITHSSAGAIFTYTAPAASLSDEQTLDNNEQREGPVYPITITLRTPDLDPSNWSLHASSIWVAGLYLADNIAELSLFTLSELQSRPLDVLELGAGAGLPGIFLAKKYASSDVIRSVTLSDYPDDNITRALEENVARNGLGLVGKCRIIPYAWDTPNPPQPHPNLASKTMTPTSNTSGFDIVLGADILFNPESHSSLFSTLHHTLRRTQHSRVHLLAGLHTGRYTLAAFLNAVAITGDLERLEVESVEEREVGVSTGGRRAWRVERAEEEDEKERRRWVVWIVLRWNKEALGREED